MELDSLVDEFLNSSHGKEAVGALGKQGIDPQIAVRLLRQATEAAARHVDAQHRDRNGAR